jgi:tetratricopeptide (TPR) repeat protein
VPPLAHDPWALIVALAVLPVVFAARSAPMGEPFSDDFLFLDFSLLRGNPSWWDGGGGVAYWRPLARQAYYGLLGPLMLSHPAAIALLHALVLAASGVLVLRALRRVWPAPAAAAAAAFPLLLEPARTLLAWPSGAQDLGALFFLSLALHAASRGRAALLAFAGVAAALCKEVAAPLAMLAAMAPFAWAPGARSRAWWGTGAALAAWGVLRFAVPHPGTEDGVAALASPLAATIPLTTRFAQAMALAARDGFSLDRAPAWAPSLAILVVLLPALAANAKRRSREGEAWRWSAWGAAWFIAGAAPLAFFLPDWASFRSALPAAGLGIALVAPIAFAPAAWLLPLAAMRLVALLLAPQPAARIGPDVSEAGDALSFPRLAQLQRVVRGYRGALRVTVPSLPRGAGVMRVGGPRMAGVAFAGDRSLRVWYRDTTLRWVGPESLAGPDAGMPVAMVEFEPDRTPQFAGVNAEALLEAAAADAEIRAGRWVEALPRLDRAEALLRDTTAVRFRANMAGGRACCLFEAGRVEEAEAQARAAMALDPDTPNGRFVLARVCIRRGDWGGAVRLLQEYLVHSPGDPNALMLLEAASRRAAITR